MLLSKNSLKKNICAVGGRSGGHIIPCIYYIAKKKNSDPLFDKTILFYSITDLTTSLITQTSYINYPISLHVPPVPYGRWYMLPLWGIYIVYSFWKSFFMLLYLQPTEVMSNGGIESIPVCLAARLLRIPVVLLELNVVPGKAILFLARFVKEVHICFEKTARYFPHNTTIVSDYPIRFSPQEITTPQKTALAYYHLHSSKKTIVILGGSQGSTSLNKIAIESIIELSYRNPHIQVIHQIGNDDFSIYKTLYLKHNIKATVLAFEKQAHYLYASADIIIARAGAGTLFEIAAFDKPACIIPLETATTDHQKDNAQEFVKRYPATFKMFLQKDMKYSHQGLIDTLASILKV